MEVIVNIILDKKIKNDYCVLLSNNHSDETINVLAYTNGTKPIDFRKVNYFSLGDSSLCENFVEYFSYGKDVLHNLNSLYVEHCNLDGKCTKEQNEELLELIKLNNLLDKRINLNIGDISLTKEDMELIKPFEECSYALINISDTNVIHSVSALKLLYEITDEVVKRTKKYDFSPLEKALYSYDIIRTNFMIDEEYEKKMEKLLESYPEPSYCYSLMYKEVLTRLGVKNHFALGNFYKTECRAMNILYIEDYDYDIKGVYYVDIGSDSKQRFLNSLVNNNEEEIKEKLINNYSGFCKTKEFMVFSGNLDMDFAFGIFDQDFMDIYDNTIDQYGINGVYQLKSIINTVGYFIDGTTVIDAYNGIKDESELDEIRNKVEGYTALFRNDISGEDFLELLFNIRKIEYMENKKIFQLSTQTLKECVFNSKFCFTGMNIELPDDEEYEQENIDEVIEEAFETYFDETAYNTKIEERIKKIKLSLNKDNNQTKDDKN